MNDRVFFSFLYYHRLSRSSRYLLALLAEDRHARMAAAEMSAIETKKKEIVSEYAGARCHFLVC